MEERVLVLVMFILPIRTDEDGGCVRKIEYPWFQNA